MNLICTPCGQPLEDKHSAIFGIEREGQMVFGWTCCHHPVGDVAVVLASADCALKYMAEHPEHRDAIRHLLETHKHSKENPN